MIMIRKDVGADQLNLFGMAVNVFGLPSTSRKKGCPACKGINPIQCGCQGKTLMKDFYPLPSGEVVRASAANARFGLAA